MFLNGKAVEVLHDQSVNRTKSLYARESVRGLGLIKRNKVKTEKANFVVLQIMPLEIET